MKLLLENWRKHIIIKEEKGKHQIYCDMDGVLVDFVKGAVDQINQDIKSTMVATKELEALREKLKEMGKTKIEEKDLHINSSMALEEARVYMYKRLAGDKKWWAELPWMSDGKRLWDFIKKYDPLILTTPMKNKASEPPKASKIKPRASQDRPQSVAECQKNSQKRQQRQQDTKNAHKKRPIAKNVPT